jgi:hypothetical protein
MKHCLCAGLAAAALSFAAAPAEAGLYSDDMGRCLVANTSPHDKTDLVRWIFAATSLHPEVASIVRADAQQREDINRRAGQLLERLLTDSCRKQTQDALKYEGPLAMQLSFQVLGQVAMQELMADPSVRKGFGEVNKYVDMDKLKALAPQAQ